MTYVGYFPTSDKLLKKSIDVIYNTPWKEQFCCRCDIMMQIQTKQKLTSLLKSNCGRLHIKKPISNKDNTADLSLTHIT